MSLTKEDLNKISKLLDEKLDQKLDQKLDEKLDKFSDEICNFIREENNYLYDKLKGFLGDHIKHPFPHTDKEYRAFTIAEGKSCENDENS